MYHGNNPEVTRWAVGMLQEQFSDIQLGCELAAGQTRKLSLLRHPRARAQHMQFKKKHPQLMHDCMRLSYTNTHVYEHSQKHIFT